MSSPQAILAHLLEGREELVREVQRLTTAIAELDAVIGRVGGPTAVDGLATPAQVPTPGQAVTGPAAQAGTRNPGGRPARKAAARGKPARAAGRATARKSVARKQARSSAAARKSASGPGQKSIRLHVLEMLESEHRDFGLAEIIDRIHGQGIEAHDDAVRSITTKLMKDGRVERVGRGQYRLARRGSARADAPTAREAGAPPRGAEAQTDAVTAPAAVPEPAPAAPVQSVRATPDQPATQAMGTPPLNLAEPWHQ